MGVQNTYTIYSVQKIKETGVYRAWTFQQQNTGSQSTIK